MKIYDLTHVIDENISVYSEEEKAKFFKLANYEDGYSVTAVTLGTHTGTHIDSPKHIFENGKSLDQYEITDFIGKALVINCSEEREINIYKIKEELCKYKGIKYILFYTGYDDKWGKDDYFRDYPILTKEAVNFLGNNRELVGIGLDCISVDKYDSLINHNILLKSNKLIIENLCGLKDKEGVYEIIISPLKLKGSDGAPIRVYLLEKMV